jgi:hypothetical protein
MRVNYNCPAAAAKARIHMHQMQFGDTLINCYFAQVRQICMQASQFLKYRIFSPLKKTIHQFELNDTPFLMSLNTAVSKE